RLAVLGSHGDKTTAGGCGECPSPSVDLLLLPLTSQLDHLQLGEFALADWKAAGLLFSSAVKRGLFTLDKARINRRFGRLAAADRERLDETLRLWLGL
ncbi:MAG: type II toxin-antitoxin system PemK/MazF family toxin, partial [Nitrospira sp.]|nr:type II toxin-antitoxin system PemK/MazF family toxin [Nitrospira sp.]